MGDICLVDAWEEDPLLKMLPIDFNLDFLMEDSSWKLNDNECVPFDVDSLETTSSKSDESSSEDKNGKLKSSEQPSLKVQPLQQEQQAKKIGPSRITKITLKGSPLVLPIKGLKNIRAIRVLESKTEAKIKGFPPLTLTGSYGMYLNLNNVRVGTDEERKLARKEGIQLPSHYPLSKDEESELKRLKRKIRNKQSAQDSRRRKKIYIDGLEDKVKRCTVENLVLQEKLRSLEKENLNLSTQLRRLQKLVKGGNKATQTSTCLFVIMLSISLLLLPNLKLTGDSLDNDETSDLQYLNSEDKEGSFSSRILLSRNDVFPPYAPSGELSSTTEHHHHPAPKKPNLQPNHSLLDPAKRMAFVKNASRDGVFTVLRPDGKEKFGMVNRSLLIGNRTVTLQVPPEIGDTHTQ